MTSQKGLKLHSIIEKLSEQCVRVNPTEDLIDEEDQQIVTVTVQPPQQRKTSRNEKARRQKRRSKAKKPKTAFKRISVHSEKNLSEKKNDESRENYQPVDDDLCIDVNALISIVPQMQDIDTANMHLAYNSWPLKKGTCSVCFQQLNSKEELLDHIKEFHPDGNKKLPVNVDNGHDDRTVETAEEEKQRQDEEEELEEESDEDSHSDTDPDFDVDVGIVSDVSDASDVSSDDMTVPTLNQKRRSARLKALKCSEKTNSYESEECPKESSDHQDGSDIHIDVDKFINTSPKLEDIDLPKSKEFTCKLCEERYYFQIEIDNHIIESHPENSKDNGSSQDERNCEHCGKEFFSRKGLLLHIKKLVQRIEKGEKAQEEKRLKTEKERTCRECGKIFNSLGNLKKHYMTHSEDRPFKCDICERTFKDKNYVYRHKKTHSGIKKYECKHCKKFFAHSGSLRTHIMLHTGERPFKCQFCDTGFISRFDLKVHENKHTGNMPYKCPHCPKGFPKSNNLKVHLISHSTDKPFPCEVCGKAFKRRDHLRYHLIIHSDDKPFKCETCNKTFNQHICLRKHLPCRELEKLEKRANKPKENSSSKKQKGPKKNLKSKKQVKDLRNKTSSTTTVAADEEREQNIKSSDRTDVCVEDNRISQQQVSYNTDILMDKMQQKANRTETDELKEQAQSKNTEKIQSSHIVHSIPSAQQQNYLVGCHGSDSNNVDPVLCNTRHDIDSEMALASLIARGSSSAIQHCSMDKVDFNHEFRDPSHGTSTSSVRTLAETCAFTSSVHQPFVPFNCSSQDAPGIEYDQGGLDLEAIPSDGSHGSMLGNRSFAQETPNELSIRSALLAAMDPDNLSAMVENTAVFFPPT